MIFTLVPNLNERVGQTIGICSSEASALVDVRPNFEIGGSLELFDGHLLFGLLEILLQKVVLGILTEIDQAQEASPLDDTSVLLIFYLGDRRIDRHLRELPLWVLMRELGGIQLLVANADSFVLVRLAL